jgi:hypothetical protein
MWLILLPIFLLIDIQRKWLNVITVGQNEIDNINQMITITGHFYKIVYYNLVKWTYEVWSVKVADNINRDHIKKHCIN